jgi:hypothetical protein
MVVRRTNKGTPIDMDKLIAANQESPAVGNMNINTAGDVVGPNGQIIKKSEERVREYYQKNPKSSTGKASLKGEMPKLKPDADAGMLTPKTSKTQKENVRKSSVTPEQVSKRMQEMEDELVAPIEPEIAPIPPVEEPEEFDAPKEPVGYKEVELPNGDIEMVPIYKDDNEDDE